jgi:hypothetical protein
MLAELAQLAEQHPALAIPEALEKAGLPTVTPGSFEGALEGDRRPMSAISLAQGLEAL